MSRTIAAIVATVLSVGCGNSVVPSDASDVPGADDAVADSAPDGPSLFVCTAESTCDRAQAQVCCLSSAIIVGNQCGPIPCTDANRQCAPEWNCRDGGVVGR
jgi:hypothetical protein